MINWLQSTFSKQGRWLVLLLLAIVILAFVFTIGSGLGVQGGDNTGPRRPYYDLDLASRKGQRELIIPASLGFEIQNGVPIEFSQLTEEQVLANAQFRYALLQLADRIGYPRPTAAQLQEYLAARPGFTGEGGRFDKERFDTFREHIESNDVYAEIDLIKVIEDNWRVETLGEAIQASNVYLPVLVEDNVIQNHSTWSIEVAQLPKDSIEISEEIDEEELAAWYELNQENYMSPAQVEAYALRFVPEAFVDDSVEVDEDALNAYLEKNRLDISQSIGVPEDRLTRDLLGGSLKNRYLRDQAKRFAAEAADSFIYQLYSDEIAFDSEAYEAALAALGDKAERVEIGITTRRVNSAQSPIPPAAIEQLFSLGASRYYSDVIQDDTGAYVAIRVADLPEDFQPLEDVREEAVAEFRQQQQQDAFDQRGVELYDLFLTGEGFAELAEENGLTVYTYSDFTRDTPPDGLNRRLIFEINGLEEGDITPMIELSNAGFFVHVTSKVPPGGEERDEAYASAVERVDQIASQFVNTLFYGDLVSLGTAENR